MAQGHDVAPLFDGAISVELGDGWARPWRLQHRERALYASSLAAMAACAAVRLRLRTKGRRVCVVASVASVPGVDADALAKVPAYPLEYDLYVDRAFFARRQCGAAEGTHTVEFADLRDGVKDVEVWLPVGAPLNVHAVDCGGEAVESPVEDARPLFLCYGSSITHGGPCSATPSGTWPAVCSRSADLRLVNLGFGAECFLDQGVARVIRDTPCDCIALKVGINIQCMSGLTARTFPAAVTGFLQTVRDGHAKTPIVVVSPIWSGPLEERAPVSAPHFLNMKQVRQHLRSVVERMRARGDDQLFYRDGLELLSRQEQQLLYDGVHPCDRGQLLMGQRFAELEFGASGRLLPGRCTGKGTIGEPADTPGSSAALAGAYACEGAAGDPFHVRITLVDGRLMAVGTGDGWAPATLDRRGDLVFVRGSPGLWGRVEGDAIAFSDGTKWVRTAAAPPKKPQPEQAAATAVRTEDRQGLQYAVMPDGVGVRYELLGGRGPCVVLIPGGQQGVCDGQLATTQFPRLGALLQLRGFRVLLHDRRNTGSSDVGYAAGRAAEAELQAGDLRLLLEHLGVGPALLVGNSSGGRLSLLLARRHPAAVRAMVLMNLTGGAVAAERLARDYYRRYQGLAESPEGMRAVCRTAHYASLCDANHANRERMRDTKPEDFAAAMRVSAEWLENSAADPVLGHKEAELQEVKHPVKVLFSMHQANCPMHTLEASKNLHAALPKAAGPVAEWQTMEAVTMGILAFLDELGLTPDSN